MFTRRCSFLIIVPMPPSPLSARAFDQVGRPREVPAGVGRGEGGAAPASQVESIQAVLRDTRMREQANVIQTEVIRLLQDLARLRLAPPRLKREGFAVEIQEKEATSIHLQHRHHCIQGAVQDRIQVQRLAEGGGDGVLGGCRALGCGALQHRRRSGDLRRLWPAGGDRCGPGGRDAEADDQPSADNQSTLENLTAIETGDAAFHFAHDRQPSSFSAAR